MLNKIQFPSMFFIGIGILSSVNLGAVVSRLSSSGVKANIFLVAILVWTSIVYSFSGRRLFLSFDHLLLIIFGATFSVVSIIQEPSDRGITNEDFQLYWKLFIFTFVFPVSLSVLNIDEINSICRGLYYGLILNFLVGLLQVFSNIDVALSLTNTLNSDVQSVRAAGFWGDSNEAAIMACMTYIIVRAIRFECRYSVFWDAVLVGFVVITASRTGLICVFLILFYNTIIEPDKQTGQKLFSIIKLFSVPVGMWVFSAISHSSDIADRFFNVFDSELRDVSDGGSRLSRWNLFSLALEAVLNQNPLLGVGAVKMSRIVPLGANGLGPHNMFLFIYGSAGIPAIILFISSLALLGYRMTENLGRTWWSLFGVMFLGFATMHSLIFTQNFALIFGILFNVALVSKSGNIKNKLNLGLVRPLL